MAKKPKKVLRFGMEPSPKKAPFKVPKNSGQSFSLAGLGAGAKAEGRVLDQKPKSSSKSNDNDNGGRNVGMSFVGNDTAYKAARGFWDKIAQGSLAAMSATLDTVLRTSYAANEASRVLGENDEDYSNEQLKYSFKDPDFSDRLEALLGGTAQTVGRNLKEFGKDVTSPGIFGKALKAGGKELVATGKDRKKTTMSENLSEAHKRNPNNPFIQTKAQRGVLGFIGDVAADPLTYTGVGMVSKPLAKAASKKIDKSLVDDLTKLKVKHVVDGDEVEMSPEDWTAIIKGAQPPNLIPVGLSRKARRKYIREHTVRGRDAFRSQKDTARQANRQLQTLEEVRKRFPNLYTDAGKRAAAAGDSKVQGLAKVFDDLDKQYRSIIDEAGKGTLMDSVARIDARHAAKSITDAAEGAAPHTGRVPVGGELSEVMSEAVHVSHLREISELHGNIKYHPYTLSKVEKRLKAKGLSPDQIREHPDWVKAVKKNEANTKGYNDLVSRWTYGGNLKGPEQVRRFFDQGEDLAKADPSGTFNEARKQANIEAGREESLLRQGLTNRAAGAKTNKERHYARANFEKVRYARELMRHAANSTSPLDAAMPPEALTKVRELQKLRNSIDPKIAEIEDSVMKGISPDSGKKELTEQQQELLRQHKKVQHDLDKEIQEVRDKYAPANPAVSKIKEIDARLAEIKRALKAPEGNKVLTESDHLDRTALEKELKGLSESRSRYMVQILKENKSFDPLEAPPEVREMLSNGMGMDELYRQIKDGKINGRWADAYVRNVEEKTKVKYNKILKKLIASKKKLVSGYLTGDYKLGDIPEHLQHMFKKGVPKSTEKNMRIDAVTKQPKKEPLQFRIMHPEHGELIKGGSANRKKMQELNLVTPADVKRAEAAQKRHNEFAEYMTNISRKGTAKKAAVDKGVYLDLNSMGRNANPKLLQPGTPIIHQPLIAHAEDFAFDRLFQQVNGMSVQSAISKLQKAAGDYVEMPRVFDLLDEQSGKFGEYLKGSKLYPVSRAEFVDFVRQYPEVAGPGRLGMQLRVDGEMWSYNRLRKEKGKWVTLQSGPNKGKRVQVLDDEWKDWWTDKVREAFKTTPDDIMESALRSHYESLMKQQRDIRFQNASKEFDLGVPKVDAKGHFGEVQKKKYYEQSDFRGHLTNDKIAEAHNTALKQTFDEMAEGWAKETDSKLGLPEDIGNEGFLLNAPVGAVKDVDIEKIADTAHQIIESNYDEALASAKVEFTPKPGENVAHAKAALENRRQQLWNQRVQAKRDLEESVDEAVEHQTLLLNKLEEQMVLHGIEASRVTGRTSVRVSFGGATVVDIPTMGTMHAATEFFGKSKVLSKANEIFATSFSPASKLAPELNKARLHSQYRVAELVKEHIFELGKTFRGIKPRARIAIFDSMRKSGAGHDSAVGKKIASEFEYLVPYFDGSIKVGDVRITLADVNAYLPTHFRFHHKDPSKMPDKIVVASGKDLVANMRNMPKGTDPMKALWALRIGVEQAKAALATKHTIAGTFGVKREIIAPDKLSAHGRMVEKLHSEHGWEIVDKIGKDYYFDPETAADIRKLLKMMEPRHVHEAVELYDKVQHLWKGAVTVYNPGYYVRNGIGEMFMGMLDGLVNPYYYQRATKVLTHMKPDATKQALKALDPMEAHKVTRDPGAAVAIKLKNGEVITVDDAQVLYSGAGLKTGFVSTEYDHVFPVAGSMRATLPGRAASGVNDAVRAAGEKYEDYFRMAHFLYRLEKTPPVYTLRKANGKTVRELDRQAMADEAANYVRKYHFDYSDFTPFEKTAMLRVFPFYKWTRKSAPLMMGMLFTKPGLVGFYPKAMQGASYATGGTDPTQDNNGFLPNYDEKVVPVWMRNMFAYPMGTPDAEGAQNYSNIATPALDIYKQISSPHGTAVGMLSPLIKVPTEQFLIPKKEEDNQPLMLGKFGRTMEPGFSNDLYNKEARLEHFIKGFGGPWGSQAWKGQEAARDPKGTDNPYVEPNGNLDENLVSFLTGLGIYENNSTRQKQEKQFNERKKWSNG